MFNKMGIRMSPSPAELRVWCGVRFGYPAEGNSCRRRKGHPCVEMHWLIAATIFSQGITILIQANLGNKYTQVVGGVDDYP